MPKKKLTAKQEKFCREYVKSLNATQASIKAGYSKKTARQNGSENLSKPAIQERIAELRAEQEKGEISFESVVGGLFDIAKGDNGMAKSGDKVSAFREVAKLMGYFEKHNDQKKNINIGPQFTWLGSEKQDG